MFRSNNTVQQLLSPLLLSLLALTPVQAAEFWVVQVGFDANGTEIQQVRPLEIAAGQRRAAQPTHDGAVVVSLRSAEGDILQQLFIDDPRVIRVPMAPGSAQGHQFVVQEKGEFTLILPAQPTASTLQLQWAEVPGQPTQQQSPTQQLSLQQFAKELQLQ